MSKTCIIDKHGDRRCGERLGGRGSGTKITTVRIYKIVASPGAVRVYSQVSGALMATAVDEGDEFEFQWVWDHEERLPDDVLNRAEEFAQEVTESDVSDGDFDGLGARRDRMKLPPEVAGDPAATFFWEHGGYGVATGEPRSKARARMALDLAASEREARERGWRVSWEEDPEPDSCQYQDEDGSWHNADECLWAALYDEDGEQLASLGGIGFNDREPEDRKHKRDYMRVVEAELASEALYEMKRKTGAGPTTPRYEGRKHDARESMRDPIDQTILDSMSRALYVSAYADAVDNAREDGDTRDWSRPGPGENWMDYAPETTRRAKELGLDLALAFERINHSTMRGLFAAALLADGKLSAAEDEDLADQFGYYMAMEALGHGVSWFDDHAEFPVKFPSTEFYLASPDDEGDGYVSTRI